MSFHVFAHCFTGWFILMLSAWLNFWYNLDGNSLSDICAINIFFLVCGLSIHFLNDDFWDSEILKKCERSFFLLQFNVFLSCPENLCPCKVIRFFTLLFLEQYSLIELSLMMILLAMATLFSTITWRHTQLWSTLNVPSMTEKLIFKLYLV